MFEILWTCKTKCQHLTPRAISLLFFFFVVDITYSDLCGAAERWLGVHYNIYQGTKPFMYGKIEMIQIKQCTA